MGQRARVPAVAARRARAAARRARAAARRARAAAPCGRGRRRSGQRRGGRRRRSRRRRRSGRRRRQQAQAAQVAARQAQQAARPVAATAGRRSEHRDHLRREPELRRPVRQVPRRARPERRGGSAGPPDGRPTSRRRIATARPCSPSCRRPGTASRRPGNPTVVTQAQTDNLPNAPFPIETGFDASTAAPTLTTLDVTRDMAHRFFENHMEINGGTNDMFAAWRRRRRAHDGPLGLQPVEALRAGAAVRAGRQLLRGAPSAARSSTTST